MFGSNAIDSRTLLEHLQSALSQAYQPSDVHVVNEKLEEVTRRLSELETARSTHKALSLSPEKTNPVKSLRNLEVMTARLLRMTFTVRVDDIGTTSRLGLSAGRDLRFIVDLNYANNEREDNTEMATYFHTVHILCSSAGKGNYDGRFPIRWNRPTFSSAQYGTVMRYGVYLVPGWRFVKQTGKFGPLHGTICPEKLYHYGTFNFLNATDDFLNPVTATNVHRIEAEIEECPELCCRRGTIYE